MWPVMVSLEATIDQPLLNVPATPADYLITWNNVVLEKRRAEGFASLLVSMDDYARRTFAASGYKLILFPPLIRSIQLGGGYRCASNHLRPTGERPSRPQSTGVTPGDK